MELWSRAHIQHSVARRVSFVLEKSSCTVSVKMPNHYDKFVLFGDSITQMSFDQEHGFGFGASLQNSKTPSPILAISTQDFYQVTYEGWTSSIEDLGNNTLLPPVAT
jgi:hypothetical protein